MRLLKRKTIIICISLIVAAIAATTLFAMAKNGTFRPGADIKIAGDLSALSGLSKEEVLKLYDAVGNWDTVRQNIFVYKKVLDLAKEEPKAYAEVFDLVQRFKAGEMLTVYEFLDNHDRDFKPAAALLAEHAKGTSLESVFATFMDTKTYKVYAPAGEEQIRRWLDSGYLPQDIINADSIAKAKDMQITDVLVLKNDSTTWEQIGRKLRYKFADSPDKGATLKIRGAAGTRTVSAKDYETLAKKENLKADQEKAELEEQVCREAGLTSVQMEVYKSKGFTFRDIQNAARLAQKSGTSMDKILQERKDGNSWETIIKAYSG